jgi:hypothetical protein
VSDSTYVDENRHKFFRKSFLITSLLARLRPRDYPSDVVPDSKFVGSIRQDRDQFGNSEILETGPAEKEI